MENILLSFIVPIYNVDKYLAKCLLSIQNQTYKNIEVLLIDDGSTDMSSKICSSFVESDSRFSYYYKENGGLSSARNYGLERIKGSFVSFIDSDDFVSELYAEKLFESFDDKTDIVISDYSLYINGKTRAHKTYKTFSSSVFDESNREELLSDILNNKSQNMPVWKNMYRVSFLTENNIRFESEREYYTEDQLFNLKAYHLSKKTIIIHDILVYHLIVPGSLSQGYRKTLNIMVKNRYCFITDYLAANNFEALLKQYENYFIEIAIDTLVMMSRCSLKEAIKNTSVILNDPLFVTAFTRRKAIKNRKYRILLLFVRKNSPFFTAVGIKLMMLLNCLARGKE